GVLGRERDGQGARIRQPHVLGGDAHHAAGDIQRILAPREHPRQPVERPLHVRPAHRLVQGGDEVEVLFAGFVVARERLFQNGENDFSGNGKRETGHVGYVVEDRVQSVQRTTGG